jgi:hypothetical protein
MEFPSPRLGSRQRDTCLILLAYTTNPSQNQSRVCMDGWTHTYIKKLYLMNTPFKFNFIDHGHF